MMAVSFTACRLLAVGICLALGAGAAPAREPTLLQQVDAVRAPDSAFTFRVAVTTPDGDALKLSVRVSGQVNSLVRYLEPPRSAGRSLLFVERNMWVYVPGTRRVLRISPQQRLLGGAANADVARVVYSLDYAPRLRGGAAGGRRGASPETRPVRPVQGVRPTGGLTSSPPARRSAPSARPSSPPPAAVISRPCTSKATGRCWDGRDRPSCG